MLRVLKGGSETKVAFQHIIPNPELNSSFATRQMDDSSNLEVEEPRKRPRCKDQPQLTQEQERWEWRR